MAMSRARGGSSVTSRSSIGIEPLGHLLEAGDHAEERRLAAAGGADEHEELARLDLERDVVDGDDVAGERLRHALEHDLAHEVDLYRTRSGSAMALTNFDDRSL